MWKLQYQNVSGEWCLINTKPLVLGAAKELAKRYKIRGLRTRALSLDSEEIKYL